MAKPLHPSQWQPDQLEAKDDKQVWVKDIMIDLIADSNQPIQCGRLPPRQLNYTEHDISISERGAFDPSEIF